MDVSRQRDYGRFLICFTFVVLHLLFSKMSRSANIMLMIK